MSAPNILLIITDQHRADHLGAYGNRTVRTPHIDRLAARGWAADRFYVSTPICMPNRSTLMTGRTPSVHGVRHNGIPLSLDVTTFPEVLRAHGYRTALHGKSHLQNMTGIPPTFPGPDAQASPASPPFELREARHRIHDEDRYEQENSKLWLDPKHHMQLPFYGFEDVSLCTNHGDQVDAEYGLWLRANLPDAEQLRGAKGAAPAPDFIAPQAWRTRIPEEFYPTTYVADQTIGWRERHASAAGDRPFFVQCSFPDPHHPFTPPGHYWSMYDPADIELPPSFSSDAPPPPHVAFLRGERDNGTADTGTQAVYAVNERQTRESTALTYGMITMIDDAIGRVLASLDQLGLAENTIVIFTSDHGDFMGDHQLMLKGAIHYQGLVRVPFIWFDPHDPAGGRRSSDLLGTIDIASTVLDRAGLGGFNGMQGRSMLPAIANADPQPRARFLIEEESSRLQMGFAERIRLRTVVTDRYRLSTYAGVPWGELYDLREDPDEDINRWNDPAYGGVQMELLFDLAQAALDVSETSPHPTYRA